MVTQEFVPKICKPTKDDEGKEIPSNFTGTITLKKPDFDQRYELIEQAGSLLDQDNPTETSGIKRISLVRKMVQLSRPFYEKVSIKRISDGKEFKSFEDISFDPVFDETLIEVGYFLMGQGQLSEK